MTISEYYEKQYYVQQDGTNEGQNNAVVSGSGNTKDFLSALAGQVEGWETVADAVQANAKAREGVAEAGETGEAAIMADPAAALAVSGRVNQVAEEELAILGTGMTPEAQQKQKELLERLDRLCAENPGVWYRLSDDIYQKMADDPEFERSLYEAVEAFEQATKYAMSISPQAETAMHVGPGGDWLLQAMLEEVDGSKKTYVYMNEFTASKVGSLQDLQELFPNLSEDEALKIWEAWLADHGEELFLNRLPGASDEEFMEFLRSLGLPEQAIAGATEVATEGAASAEDKISA